jgi:oligopeptide/dipeptide ABC transporter ATP-binding protein
MAMRDGKILEIKNLSAEIATKHGCLHIINGINFSVHEEECFGIIGESGCGKTMTSMTILRYSQRFGLHVKSGEILYDGEDVLKYSKKQLQEYNGGEVAIIMQDAMSALDPLYTIKDQLLETIRRHQKLSKKKSIRQMQETIRELSIPEEKLQCYPHQLSGGMLQRIVGAIAVSCSPRIIIADEPTTALDVTIQLQYLKLLKRIQKNHHTAIIFISHDIHVISMMCDRIAVMYAGEIVEMGSKKDVFNHPAHPYTRLLFQAANLGNVKKERCEVIEGAPPDLKDVLSGCAFAARCPYHKDICQNKKPRRATLGNGHEAQCWGQLREEND